MKQIKLILLTILIFTPFLGLEAQTKILFIGNSFTIGSKPSVPEIFDALARAGGHDDPLTVMRASGGKDFEYHLNNAEAQVAIASQLWDFVVLQNFSTGPTHLRSVASHLAYGQKLYQRVMENNPKTQVILYETWARSALHEMISGTRTNKTFATTTSMQEELRANYNLLADMLNLVYPENPEVLVAPCGSAWENAGALLDPADPGFVRLHWKDEYHGTDDGYFLNALVFYCVIYKCSPEGLHLKPEIQGLEGLSLTVDPAMLETVAWETYCARFAPDCGKPEPVPHQAP